MPATKNAPESGQGLEGDDQNPSKGTIMYDDATSVLPTTVAPALNSPSVTFYTLDGERIPIEEHNDHDLLKTMVSFNNAAPQPAEMLSHAELATASAWLMFLARDAEREAELMSRFADAFKGYPKDTKLVDILAGKATKIEAVK